MTLPFENDTSKIIKRISNKSLNSNHKRNLFTILTIALASALLSAIVLYGFPVAGNIDLFGDSSDRSNDIDFLYNRDLKKTVFS